MTAAPAIPALTWVAWAGADNLATMITCNFDGFDSYEIAPFGQFGRDQVFASGVIIRNLDNQTPVVITMGPLKFTVSAFKQESLAIQPGYPPLSVTGESGLVELIFYRGAYPASLQTSNDFDAQKVAALGTLANGSADAYLNSLRWNENIQLDATFDLNGLTISGFYDCTSPTNGPGAGNWNIEVIVSSLGAGYLTQIARGLDQGTYAEYVRRRLAGVWSGWSKQITPDNGAFNVGLNAPSLNTTGGISGKNGSFTNTLTANDGSIAGDFTVNGHQLNPAKRPMFLARLAADTPIGNGLNATNLSNITYNRGNNFNGVRFTAPLAGAYHFAGAVQFTTGGASAGFYGACLRVNGGDFAGPNFTQTPQTTSSLAAMPISSTLLMSVGDYVELWWQLSSGTGTTWALQNFRTFFSGHYIG